MGVQRKRESWYIETNNDRVSVLSRIYREMQETLD